MECTSSPERTQFPTLKKRQSGSILLIEAVIMATLGLVLFLVFFVFRSRSEYIDYVDCQVMNNGTPCAGLPGNVPPPGGGMGDDKGNEHYPE